MSDQAQKAARFRALHEAAGAFVVPNPWDAGTAKLLTSYGFPALATTSAGFAYSLGRPDGAGRRRDVRGRRRRDSRHVRLDEASRGFPRRKDADAHRRRTGR